MTLVSAFNDLAGKQGNRPAGPGKFLTRCPVPGHGKGNGDRTPSLLVSQTPAGGIAVKCFVGCEPAAVREALGLPQLDYRENADYRIADYEHPDGRQFKVYRRECAVGRTCDYPNCEPSDTKHIWQTRGGKAGAYALMWGEDDGAAPLIWTEGEKAALAVAQAGFVAVSTIGGTSLAGKANYSRLAGRELWLWPDNDAAGVKAAAAAAAAARADGVAAIFAVGAVGKPGGDAADMPIAERQEWLNAAIAERQPAPLPTTRKDLPTVQSGDDDVGLKTGDYFSIGRWYGGRLLSRFIYDPELCAWYSYAGGVWDELLSEQVKTRIVTPLIADCYALADDLHKAGYELAAKRIVDAPNAPGWIMHDAGILGGVRHAITARLPVPEQHFIGTPGGVVDLMTGELHPHSPDWGLRCLTAGRYRPEDADYLRERLEFDRYNIPANPILTPGNLATLINQVGLTLTARGTNYTALTLIMGKSGSGKGGTVDLVKRALGGYAMAAPENLLERHRTDIDAGLADIIDKQPRMLAHDEIAADDQVSIARLLGLTGNKPLNARRPHGSMRSGTSPAVIWTTAVDTPNWTAGAGFMRRLSVIHTARPLPDADKNVGIEQDFLDAIVTLGIQAAAAVYRAGYNPPYGVAEARRETIGEMDGLALWLEDLLPENWNGKETNDARAHYNEGLEEGDGVSKQVFAAAVKRSSCWRIAIRNTNARKNIRVLEFIGNGMI